MAELFRKQSMEKIASPDDLNDYIRISEPAVWIILTGIGLLLTGGLLWGVTGHLDTVTETSAIVEDAHVCLLIPESEISQIGEGTMVRLGDVTVPVSGIAGSPVQLTGEAYAYALHVGNYTAEDWLYLAEAEASLEDGVYPAYVTTGTVSPISFLFN